MKVLIADDSLLSRTTLRRALSAWDYEIVEARDGQEAWNHLQGPDAPRIAILDWYMPLLEGVAICERLRQREQEPYVYAILLTAKNDRDNLISGLEAGADDFLFKPFDPQELELRLRAGARIIQLQDRLLATQQSLRERNQEIDEFAYVASHDLQEPVRKMISFSSLLKEDLGENLNEQAARDVDYIVDSATRMRNLIQDLLALSRTGRSDMKQELLSLDQCVDRALHALQIRLEETGAEIARTPLPQVQGDATLLTQLYQNLIGNALKFTAPDRRPVVQLTCHRDPANWVLGVKDNGIGMKPEHADRIFQPFQRLHGRGEYEGTGIGLAICKKAVQRHGGQLWVTSSLDEGAHFQFTLCDHQVPGAAELVQESLALSS